MFVSNSDNLGATLDLSILSYFAGSDAPFMMECCKRTPNDKKGGHLAKRVSDGQLILRESAMCADEDEEAFQDISKHRFFNTNNLWIRLDKLKEIINENGGFIPLPMIKNKKTVDPKDDSSQKVLQLETAMGAAIECFKGATAIVVPRTRFAPVKKCNDLLLLRSQYFDPFLLKGNCLIEFLDIVQCLTVFFSFRLRILCHFQNCRKVPELLYVFLRHLDIQFVALSSFVFVLLCKAANE